MFPIFIKFNGFFVPTNLSDNNLRHFGFKSHKILFLEVQELLYLLSKDLNCRYPARIRAYFDIKNSGYNVLPKIQLKQISNTQALNIEQTSHSFDDLLKTGFVLLDFRDLKCSKTLKKFTKEKINEIKTMEKKLEEFTINYSITNYKYLIYKRTKNFKRTDEPIGCLHFINKFEKVCDVLKDVEGQNMICLLSDDDFILLDIQKLEALNFELEPRLKKGP